ncbi:MAG TPA: DMT family transporter [Hyphomicrobiaceae bacterium]|nr:DMT family transporter [Hyphomicrobiaceae bacterium]
MATTLGVGAILLWATLASLTALKGGVPPFATTAVSLAIGGAIMAAVALVRGRPGLLKPTLPSLGLGIYGLFVYHALYFSALRLAPPAEASLITSMWALFTVLFSALLPGHRLRPGHIVGALLGFAAAFVLTHDKLGGSADLAAVRWGYVLAAGCALVWSSFSVASRLLAAVPSESLAAPALVSAVLAALCSLAFETWTGPEDWVAWAALAAIGAGPLGIAFLLWDIGMKKGNVPLLGVLSYAALIISTAMLVILGFAEPAWTLAVACALMVTAAVLATRP